MPTYYIDFVGGADANAGTSTGAAWKRAPGMTGFTGAYAHAAGDRFVFKGGVTWTSAVYPWTVANSGGAGNPDVYTTDHTWFSGGSFTRPIFDAQATEPAGGMLQASSKSNLTFNDLAFTNYATTGVSEAKKALDFVDCQGLTFSNNTFTCFCWITLYVHHNIAGAYSGFTFTNNDISHTSAFVWYASSAGGITRSDVTYTGNILHDGTSQIGGGVHGDGWWHSFGPDTITGLTFANNLAYGDWRQSFAGGGGMTAYFFCEEGGVSGLIANNVIAPSPTQPAMFEGLVSLKAIPAGATVEFYNNSLWVDAASGNPGAASITVGVSGTGGGTLKMKNNTSIGFQYAVDVETTTSTFDFDNNLWDSTSGQLVFGGAFQSYATWQAAGRDVHGVLGVDPLYRTPPSDLHLQSTSQAIGAGVNLTSLGYALLNSDKDGVARPASGPWDAGAYEIPPSPPTPPAPPTTLVAARGGRVMRVRHGR